MPSFKRICSGLRGLDEAVDSIRLGDNVVWQVSSIEDFHFVAEPFIRQAIREGRNLIYIHFARHPQLTALQEGLKIFEIDPSKGFEAFTVQVHEIIAREGRKAFYVFDCLSDLQEAWSTDLMMGNFFRVTCPYLFQLDTVAYFPVLRGMHSFDAIARIRETTQLFLEVYRSGDAYYIHPLKASDRYSSTMFTPHRFDAQSGGLSVIADGVAMGRFYHELDQASGSADQNLDSWDRYFSMLKLQHAGGMLPEGYGRNICGIMMTRDEKIAALIEAHFSPRDYFLIRDRMIGTGMIGGKACGVLLARKLVSVHLPELASNMEAHDSYYIGSDVFYTYIVHNDCWRLRIQQRAEREGFALSAEFGRRLKQGTFPQDLREQFRRMLDYFGQSPIIIRSSSFLEDGFGNAFAGKYESVFYAGGGDLEQRLQAFEEAVKTVYASTMDPSALEYRKRRGLLEQDEQMAVLVQRVSGARHGDLFLPTAAGVGYSHNAYRWMDDMDPAAGMLRLVAGLGTRAVGRTEGDYPRVISLDRPLASNLTSMKDRHRYSQHQADVLDLKENSLCEKPLNQLAEQLPFWYQSMVFSHDTDAEQYLRELGQYRDVLFADCQGLAANPSFTECMKKMMKLLEAQYGTPVDIEFTVNGSANGDFSISLLQCRALKVAAADSVAIPQPPAEHILFDVTGTSMGRSRQEKIDILVFVDPGLYARSGYGDKAQTARIIGKINQAFYGQDLRMMLMVPGRIGTSSPELGIPVVYAEISMFCAVCEISFSAAGYMPELSFGSHMFQDLVESDMYYGAIFEDQRTRWYRPELLEAFQDRFLQVCPSEKAMAGMIRVYDLTNVELVLRFDMMEGRALCALEDRPVPETGGAVFSAGTQ